MKFPHLLSIKNVSVRNEVLHQPSENMLSIEGEALIKSYLIKIDLVRSQSYCIYVLDTSNHLCKNTSFFVPSINIAAAKFQNQHYVKTPKAHLNWAVDKIQILFSAPAIRLIYQGVFMECWIFFRAVKDVLVTFTFLSMHAAEQLSLSLLWKQNQFSALLEVHLLLHIFHESPDSSVS